jgi:hypothetical protein
MEPREMVRLLVGQKSNNQVIVSRQKQQYLIDYAQCRTIAKGCQVFKCDECSRATVVYNPCNRRGCPVCARKNQLAWLQSATNRLIPVGHIHLVFSFPAEVTDQWRMNPKKTIGALFRAVNRTLRKFEEQAGVTTGRMMVFQSHGRGLSYKAHLHCLMTSGGIDDQGKWVGLGVLPLARMTGWIKSYLPENSGEKGWRVHQTHHVRGGEQVAGYLAQRQIGMVVKPEQVTASAQDIDVTDRGSQTSMDPSTFVQRYLDHVPEKGSVMIRNYGLYSNRKKELHSAALTELRIEDSEEPAEKYTPECPNCKVALSIKAVYLANKAASFERWGFETHPPGHWEFGNAC